MERLDPRTWLEEAKKLAVGKSARLDHDCGSGRTLLVQHKENGWDAWCHRCGIPGWVPHPHESLSQKIARLSKARLTDDALRDDPELPRPQVRDPYEWPLEARVWLYKAGMSREDIMAAGFYYHERTQRVVLPIYYEGSCVYWQARGVDRDRPKYLNPKADKSLFLARFSGRSETGGQDTGRSRSTLVVTEDLLSAWKVSHRGGYDSLCLLGTSLSDRAFTAILAGGYDRVALWLDPDAAGVKGSSKAIKRLRSYGVETTRVVSSKDPKLLHGYEIRSVLG